MLGALRFGRQRICYSPLVFDFQNGLEAIDRALPGLSETLLGAPCALFGLSTYFFGSQFGLSPDLFGHPQVFLSLQYRLLSGCGRLLSLDCSFFCGRLLSLDDGLLGFIGLCLRG